MNGDGMSTDYCPVCTTMSERLGERDYQDKVQYGCPRCGEFEISRTALVMLKNFADHGIERSRISHALRSLPRTPGERFMITSANLESLAEYTLPGIEQQIENLLRWILSEVGEDELGRVTYKDAGHLAGVIGAKNNKNVARLIQMAEEKGLVDFKHGNQLALTLDGKTSLTHASGGDMSVERETERPKAKDAPELVHDDNKVVKANCNTCGGDRNAFRRREFEKRDNDGVVSFTKTIEILECCGCGRLSVRKTDWCSENFDYEQDPLTGEVVLVPETDVSHWPPPSRRKPPGWFERIDRPPIRSVFKEIYRAIDHDALSLATMGTRTVIDHVMTIAVGDVKGGFEAKLNKMVEQGHMGEKEKRVLMTMIDAGSAASHRAYVPDLTTLEKVLDVAELLVQKELVVPSYVDPVENSTPKRDQK